MEPTSIVQPGQTLNPSSLQTAIAQLQAELRILERDKRKALDEHDRLLKSQGIEIQMNLKKIKEIKDTIVKLETQKKVLQEELTTQLSTIELNKRNIQTYISDEIDKAKTQVEQILAPAQALQRNNDLWNKKLNEQEQKQITTATEQEQTKLTQDRIADEQKNERIHLDADKISSQERVERSEHLLFEARTKAETFEQKAGQAKQDELISRENKKQVEESIALSQIIVGKRENNVLTREKIVTMKEVEIRAEADNLAIEKKRLDDKKNSLNATIARLREQGITINL